MSYEDFTQALLKEIRRQAGEEYQVALQTIKKNNGVSRDAVSITRKDCKVAPLIYIGSFYERYQGGSSVVRLAACLLENYYEMDDSLLDINTDFFSDYENAKKHLYCKLVNIGMNREILREIPYRTYLDLAVVYYYMTASVGSGQATILINKNHLEMWGITGEELDRQAWENTVSDLKASLRPMGEILRECFLNADVDVAKTEDEAEYRIFPMYVLTNQKKTFGAICIRYPGMLKELSEKFGGDFYILPSSVHECILVPADETVSRDMLKEMVTDINQTQVEPQEILANQAYLYSRTLNQIVF